MRSWHYSEIDTPPTSLQRLERETAVWSRLHHPNILPFIGLFTLHSKTFMVSLWMANGHAFDYVQKHPRADRPRIVYCSHMRRLLESLLTISVTVGADRRGVEILARFGSPGGTWRFARCKHLSCISSILSRIFNGDLSFLQPNIFISESGDVRIADFGLSEFKTDVIDPQNSTTWYLAGHARWQAPELLKGESKIEMRRTIESDVFSFGRVMIEVGCPLPAVTSDIMSSAKTEVNRFSSLLAKCRFIIIITTCKSA